MDDSTPFQEEELWRRAVKAVRELAVVGAGPVVVNAPDVVRAGRRVLVRCRRRICKVRESIMVTLRGERDLECVAWNG